MTSRPILPPSRQLPLCPLLPSAVKFPHPCQLQGLTSLPLLPLIVFPSLFQSTSTPIPSPSLTLRHHRLFPSKEGRTPNHQRPRRNYWIQHFGLGILLDTEPLYTTRRCLSFLDWVQKIEGTDQFLLWAPGLQFLKLRFTNLIQIRFPASLIHNLDFTRKGDSDLRSRLRAQYSNFSKPGRFRENRPKGFPRVPCHTSVKRRPPLSGLQLIQGRPQTTHHLHDSCGTATFWGQ